MKSCQSLKQEVSAPCLGRMSQEEGRRPQVSQSYYRPPMPEVDLTGKLYKREAGGKPYSVLVDNKMATKTAADSAQQYSARVRQDETYARRRMRTLQRRPKMMMTKKRRTDRRRVLSVSRS